MRRQLGEEVARYRTAARVEMASLHGRTLLPQAARQTGPRQTPRWTAVYHIYGYGHFHHLRLKSSVSEEVSELPTVSGVWRTANWHEREAYDMMGIRFSGHPDLRRILMWEGYPYFPLRKDFPLAGKPSEMPDVAFSDPAPLEGGPFVTMAGGKDSIEREPRVRNPGG